MNYLISLSIVILLAVFLLSWLNTDSNTVANRNKFKNARLSKQKRLLLETDKKRSAKSHNKY